MKRKWTEEEIELLINVYPMGMEASIQALGRSQASLVSQAARLGIAPSRTPTLNELEVLKSIGEHSSILGICRQLKRSWKFVYGALRKLGIVNKFDNSKKWVPNQEEIEVLRSRMTITEMSVKLNRSFPTIRKQMRAMSLMDLAQKRIFKPVSRVRIKYAQDKVVATSVPRDLSGESRIKEALRRIGL